MATRPGHPVHQLQPQEPAIRPARRAQLDDVAAHRPRRAVADATRRRQPQLAEGIGFGRLQAVVRDGSRHAVLDPVQGRDHRDRGSVEAIDRRAPADRGDRRRDDRLEGDRGVVGAGRLDDVHRRPHPGDPAGPVLDRRRSPLRRLGAGHLPGRREGRCRLRAGRSGQCQAGGPGRAGRVGRGAGCHDEIPRPQEPEQERDRDEHGGDDRTAAALPDGADRLLDEPRLAGGEDRLAVRVRRVVPLASHAAGPSLWRVRWRRWRGALLGRAPWVRHRMGAIMAGA